MFQGGHEAWLKNQAALGFDPGRLDFVLLTHAHIDHSGLLPRQVAMGYRGPVHVTGATAELLQVILLDSAHLQEKEAEWRSRHRDARRLRPMTPLYTVDQARALLCGAVDPTGAKPAAEVCAMLMAHSALETGQWQRMFNFNAGNVTTLGVLPYYLNPPSDTAHLYRSYDSAPEGFRDFVQLVAGRYPKAWALLGSGDAAAYVRELKAGGYFEGPEGPYAVAVGKLYRQFLAGGSVTT
jgi:hypothetical protein